MVSDIRIQLFLISMTCLLPKAQFRYMAKIIVCHTSVLINYHMDFKYQNGSVYLRSVLSCGKRKTRTFF